MCNFHVGQKVVAVSPHAKSFFGADPVTVCEVLVCSCGLVHLTILESVCVIGPFNCSKCKKYIAHTAYYGAHSESFRPLIEDYTEEEIEAVNIDEVIEPFLEPIER